MRIVMGFLLQPKDASDWVRKKDQEGEEILYYGAVHTPLNLTLDRTAKISLAEQIRRCRARYRANRL
jgi:hypothetical protein